MKQRAAWIMLAAAGALAFAIELALVAALTGCGHLPTQEPPVVLDHLTRVTWCAGPDRIVEYLRPDGVMSARLTLYRHPECSPTQPGRPVRPEPKE